MPEPSAMLQDVDLQFYPSATNCLAWNQDDGQLAIAAGEYVHILVFPIPLAHSTTLS